MNEYDDDVIACEKNIGYLLLPSHITVSLHNYTIIKQRINDGSKDHALCSKTSRVSHTYKDSYFCAGVVRFHLHILYNIAQMLDAFSCHLFDRGVTKVSLVYYNINIYTIDNNTYATSM